MLVSATRTLSALTARAIFYAVLFAVVVIVHVAITSALRGGGWAGGAALLVSGGVVLGVVLVLINLADFIGERRAATRERMRLRQGLPGGPCCVIWRAGEGEADMPWVPVAPVHPRYPALARRLGVEGVALVEFEINAQGEAKNVQCLDAWPSDVFFAAAREALEHARFEPREDAHVHFGASYRMPFVFRIAGSARPKISAQRGRAQAAGQSAANSAAEKLRGGA